MDGTSARAALGLSPGATQHEVKRSYRTLAMHAHPDRGGNAAWFDYLTQAYTNALADCSFGPPLTVELAVRPRSHPFLNPTLFDQPTVGQAPFRRPRPRPTPQGGAFAAQRSFAQELELALAG